MIKPSQVLKDHSQFTLDGAFVSENMKRLIIEEAIANTENIVSVCPFCLQSQNLREMRFLNEYGTEASKMLKCKYRKSNLSDDDFMSGVIIACPKGERAMQKASMIIWLQGAFELGVWVGQYPDFWQVVDHDVWIPRLKALAKAGKLIVTRSPPERVGQFLVVGKWPQDPMGQFWAGYSQVRPQFAEKQKQKQKEWEYEQANGGFAQEQSETDDYDESGR